MFIAGSFMCGGLVWFGLVSLFSDISTFMGYLVSKPSLYNNSGTINP